MNKFNSSQTVGEIVSIMPKASEIFKQYKIDFCCGGNRPLTDVLYELHLDENLILNKINEIFEESNNTKEVSIDFRALTSSELIDHIENTHHAYTKRVLPELGELTTKIMQVHGINHKVLFRVHKLFSMLKTELEQHLLKEEQILFPLIKKYDKNPSVKQLQNIDEVINETEDEHEAAGDILKELRKITDDFKVPNDGCNTYVITFKTLEELEADLFQHIHLENNILFKRITLDVNKHL
ncbi:iron-sulfur cluster repair di-iron protein [Clostridium subterminale]|uniref:Iron-sulfur cluster repair di-iron protein n=1 Tax=Clostridium subterminale TaxID=1550 RepID=A0ABN1KPL4_CLOSU